jgi:hypothetical protein
LTATRDRIDDRGTDAEGKSAALGDGRIEVEGEYLLLRDTTDFPDTGGPRPLDRVLTD